MREALMQWSSGARGRRHPRLGGAAAWLVAALMGMPSSGLAAVPEVGQDITGALEVRIGKRIPLPQGRWKVETVFQEPQQLIMPDGQPYTRPRHIVVLSHEDARAEVPLIVLDFTDAERLNWTGQPCDTPTRNPALLSNTLGTTASSLSVRCNRVFAYDNFRATIARGNISANAWMAKRFGTLSSRAPGLPVHGLFAEGSMSAHLGDRLFVLAYANPGVHGLDGAADQPNPFRAPAGGHAAALQSYMSAFATWFDAYTDQIAGSYLQGGLSAPTVAVFRFNAPTSPAQAAMSTAATAVAPAAHARAQAPAQAAAPPATPRATVAAVPAAPVVPAKPATSAASALSVHALVVGNAAYPGARLVNSGNDANAVAARLRSYGFDVSLVLDAGRRQLVEALAQFAGKARQADVTLFFYAGHGGAAERRELPDPGGLRPRRGQGHQHLV